MDPVQKELQRYIDIRDHLQEEIQVLEEQRSTFVQDLLRFEGEFLQNVDPLQKKLERWIHRCRIVEEIIQRFSSRDEIPLTSLDWRQEIENDIQPPADTPLPEPIPDLSPDEKAEAKSLFRKLARRFHPDLVQDGSLQEERATMMNRINQAYQKYDLSALRELVEHPDIVDLENATAGDQWSQIVREIAHLRKCIAQREKDFNELRQSDMASLMQTVEVQGSFQHIQEAIQQKIQLQMARWRQLRVREEEQWLGRDG